MRLVAGISLLSLLIATSADARQPTPPETATDARVAVLVSDLHLGLGCERGCHPMEDGRWPVAWQGFLDHLSAKYGPRVDLVILGDFLELWQHPDVRCKNGGADVGCSAAEARSIVEHVVEAHPRELGALRRFAEAGDNRVVIVPGNHDAALLLPDVRQPLVDALGISPNGRVTFEEDGRWVSPGGTIAGEHGHQIGPDPNRFDDWPTVTLSDGPKKGFLVRTWGENFVQTLYNDVEAQFPTIDNLTPEGAGVKLYMAERGKGGSLADAGRFVLFHVFQTSLRQKGALGAPPDPASAPEEALTPEEEKVVRAGRSKGHYLVAAALPPGDPLRTGLLDGPEQDWGPLRIELSQRIADPQRVSAPEVLALCQQAHELAKQHPGTQVTSCSTSFGAALLAKPLRSVILRRYLEGIAASNPALRVFVYGHTHAARVPKDIPIQRGQGTILVANTGAFQRLGPAPASTKLSETSPEQLPGCYGFVVVSDRDEVELMRWRQDEAGPAGRPVGACDESCLPKAAGCE